MSQTLYFIQHMHDLLTLLTMFELSRKNLQKLNKILDRPSRIEYFISLFYKSTKIVHALNKTH